jgi:hypothetical protein
MAVKFDPLTGKLSVSSGDASSFKTVQVPTGTSPVATSGSDTLTLTSGDGSITVTGNATTDTVDLKTASSLWPAVQADTCGDTIGTSQATLVFTHVAYDVTSCGGYSTSTGKFTVPTGQGGLYEIAIELNSQSPVSCNGAGNGAIICYLGRNASNQDGFFGSLQYQAAISMYISLSGSVKVMASAGDTLYVSAFRAGNVVSYNLEPSAIYNRVSFTRIK